MDGVDVGADVGEYDGFVGAVCDVGDVDGDVVVELVGAGVGDRVCPL